MGLRKLGGFSNLPTLNLDRQDEGTRSRFKLISKKDNAGNFNKTVYTVDYTGDDLKKLQKELDFEGTKMQVWGSTVIDRNMAELQPGDEIEVIYHGKKPSPTKGNGPYKDYEFFVVDPEYDGDDSVSDGKTKDEVPF